MEPHNYQRLLFFSFFSLTTFNPALAVCVPRNSIYPHTSSPPPYTSPNPQPAASPGPQAVPPQSPPRPLSLGPFSARESALKPPSTQILKINPLKINPGATNTNPAIKKICDSTDYPETCISSITPFLNGRTDPVSVVQMAIKAATLYTTLAISTATKLATIPGTSPKMVSIIKDCKDSYSDALDNFQNAMAALRTLDIGTMNSMLSAAISDFCDCDDELTGQRSPLLEFNGRLSNMTGNCLNIVSMIK